MLKNLTKVKHFYRWWSSTLYECLPQVLRHYLFELNKDIDYVIAHQGNTVFIQKEKGEIIDSVSVLDTVSEAPDETDIEKSLNQPINNAARTIDDQTLLDQELAAVGQIKSTVDLDLTQASGDDRQAYDIDLSTQASPENVIPLKISRDNDKKIVLGDVFQAADPQGFNETHDEDTIIIQNDQGRLIHVDAFNAMPQENTELFCNDGGILKQVDADELNTEVFYAKEDDYTDVTHENDLGMAESREYRVIAQLLSKYQKNKKCLYLLPEEKLFILNLTYPVQALENIENVLRYDLEKHIPLSFEEIRYFYALNLDSASNKVNVEVAVLKAQEFDLLNLSLGRFVGEGLLCTTSELYRKYGNKINFLKPEVGTEKSSAISFSGLHMVFNWAIVLLLLVLPFYLINLEREQLVQQSLSDVKRAKDLVTMVNSINSEVEFGSQLTNRVNQSQRVIDLLNSLSAHINQQAWITRFTYRNNEIKIKGEAQSATSVSDDLNETGLFESIKFISSIIKNPRTGNETFELLMVIKDDA